MFYSLNIPASPLTCTPYCLIEAVQGPRALHCCVLRGNALPCLADRSDREADHWGDRRPACGDLCTAVGATSANTVGCRMAHAHNTTDDFPFIG